MSHHFFDANDEGLDDCAITDISIRVDANGDDVVTYCGISSHGSSAGGFLAPLLPFAMSAPCLGGAPVGLPSGQWDGIVGRVKHTGAGSATRVFHSIVSGGTGQDGLFGIAEIDENRFAVVGSTEDQGGTGGFPFPGTCGGFGSPSVLGTLLVFDATLTPTGGNLSLTDAKPLGSAGSGVNTVARDVLVGRAVAHGSSAADDLLYVVGSTNDAAFTSGGASFLFAPPAGQNALQGATDGFVAAMWFAGGAVLLPYTFSYHGGQGNDGLTGVNGWNEFSEHMAVTGFTDDGAGGGDIDVATYFFNNATGPTPSFTPTSPPNFSEQLVRMRRTQFGGMGQDGPAVMGPIAATRPGSGLAWSEFGLGQESGGGVAVGPDGRINVAGRSDPGGGYPVVGAGARSADLLLEAVRTEFDLLPRTAGTVGTGRTDGTGFQGGGVGPFPPPVASGYTGGTTPFCALVEFGAQVGVSTPGQLPRMLIDFEGDAVPGSTNTAIVVCRPTPQSGSPAVGALQFGFPPTLPVAYVTGCEHWLSTSSATTFTAFGFNQVFRMQLPSLPPGAGPYTAQLTCLLPAPVTGPASGCSSQWTASPALWFNW